MQSLLNKIYVRINTNIEMYPIIENWENYFAELQEKFFYTKVAKGGQKTTEETLNAINQWRPLSHFKNKAQWIPCSS